VAIAVLGLLTFGWIFTGHYLLPVGALCGLDWLLVNLLNRVVDLPEDHANRITGTPFVARHRGAILIAASALLVVSLAFTAIVLPAVTALRIAFHLLGAAYNWRIRPGARRLKERYFWKNSASALGFMLTVFGYPLATAIADGGPPLRGEVGPVFVGLCAIFFFAFELSYEVIYDLRDVPGDALIGARTYPVVHGVATACRIIDGLLVLAVVTLIGGYLADALPWRVVVMVVAPVAQAVAYRRALRRGGVTASDCIAITWLGALELLVYHLWIALRLPGIGG
jgi:4-hydroxybenzoate polyprenyltransferase